MFVEIKIESKEILEAYKEKIIEHYSSLHSEEQDYFFSSKNIEAKVQYLIDKYLPGNYYFLVLDTVTDVIISFSYMINNYNYGEIVLSVIPEYRGYGFGRSSIQEIERFAKKNNISQLLLIMSKKNKPVINLAKHCGYDLTNDQSKICIATKKDF